MAPALGWTRQLAKPHTRRTFRNAGFTSEVRIAAPRDLPAAGVRSGIGHHAGSALGTRRVSRAAARDLLASDRAPVSTDAFHYQWGATERFCRGLHATATQSAHVARIAGSRSES